MEENTKVYYIAGHQINTGNAINIEKKLDGFTFQIDSYGSCEGQFVISNDQIGRTVFLTQEEAEKAVGK